MYSKVISLILFILSLSGYTAQTQNIYFDRLYDFSSSSSADGSGGIISNETGDGYYFVARSLETSNWFSTGILCKINDQGDTLLTVKISNENKSCVSTKLTHTSDGGIVIGSTLTDTTTGKSDYSLAKVNNLHTIDFIKSYGDSINDEQVLQVINTYDKGFLIVGQSVVPPNVSADMYVVKTDSIGNFEWEQYYGGSSFEAAYSVIQAPDSGYLILGWTQSFSNNGLEDFYLVKTDKQGNQQWQKTYGGSAIDIGLSICSLANGNYLLSGGAGGNGVSSGILRKIDAEGNTIWVKTLKHETNHGNEIFRAIELSDGSLISTGVTDITDNAGWLIKTDSAGNKIWSRMYNNNANTDLFYDMVATDDGGFLLAGLAWNDSNGSQDAWLLKVDSVGCAYENCLVGIDEAGSKKVLVDVYPNPAADVLYLELQEVGEIYEVELTDINGRKVYSSEIGNQKTEISVNGFANGIYLLTLQNAEQKATLKIVIQH